MKYINSFASLIPALQGNRAIRKVEKMRQKGEIQSEQEYANMLAEILAEISGETYAPTFTYRPFLPGYSSSENYNLMLSEIRDDLEVAFIELNNIFSVIQAQTFLLKDKTLNDLYYSVEQLETESTKLSIIANPDNAFKDADFNTFAGDIYKLSRLEPFAKELFYDRREDIAVLDEDIVSVDVEQELIALPLSRESQIEFSEISIVETQTTGSDFNIELIDSTISSIKTRNNTKSWIKNILKQSTLANGSELVLSADLGDKRLVNYLFIKPVSDFPSILKSISYINENNQEILLDASIYFGMSLSSSVKIPFDDIVARRFIIKLQQESSVLFSYDPLAEEISLDDIRRNTSLAPNAQTVKDQLTKQISDIDLIEVLAVSEKTRPKTEVVYKYTFGFTEISTGLAAYKNKGFFISKPYRKETPGLVAIEAFEVNSTYLDLSANVSAVVGSFEYDIIKKDYNSKNELINTREFPILPLGTQLVTGERLPFSGVREIVSLRFVGHQTGGSGENIKVFRNNIELTRGADWTFEDRRDTLDLSDPLIKQDIFQTRIRILQSKDVVANGIYTCDYTPRLVSQPNDLIIEKGIVYSSTGVTEHSSKTNGNEISYSDIYVKITIRNNSFYGNKSPRLDSYRLLTSPVNLSISTT